MGGLAAMTQNGVLASHYNTDDRDATEILGSEKLSGKKKPLHRTLEKSGLYPPTTSHLNKGKRVLDPVSFDQTMFAQAVQMKIVSVAESRIHNADIADI